MPQFFISSKNIIDNKITIDDKDNYNHIARALRIRKGERLLLIDENEIQYDTIVENVTSNSVVAQIKSKSKSIRKLPFELYLAQSPLRSDAQNILVEKATELGIKGLYPIKTDNCTVSEDNIKKKIPKWQKIMFEASKQCERADIPTCFDLTTFENLFDNFDRIFVFCERIADKKLCDLPKVENGQKVLVVVGPEGGFSQREFALFKNKNLDMLTLGNMILKAETAVTVALGNIVYEFTR